MGVFGMVITGVNITVPLKPDMNGGKVRLNVIRSGTSPALIYLMDWDTKL